MVAFIALVLFCYCLYILETDFSWWAIGGIVVSILVALWYCGTFLQMIKKHPMNTAGGGAMPHYPFWLLQNAHMEYCSHGRIWNVHNGSND